MRPSVPKYLEGTEVAEHAQAKQLAALLIQPGMTLRQAAKEMGLRPHKAKELSNSYTCKEALARMGEEAVATAKGVIKSRTAGLAEKVIDTLEFHLKKKNLNAIGPVLKILGITGEEVATGDTSINIVLPTGVTPQEEPRVITPEYKEVKG